MSTDLERFLTFLFEADTGYVYSPLKRLGGEYEQKFFQWPSAKQELIDWITTSSLEGNIYLSPAIWKEKVLSKQSFKTSNVAWVEFDGAKEISYRGLSSPDAVVQTSTENKVHVYWKIQKVEAEALEDINRRLTYFLGADSSGWDCTQVLRPPETLNHKYGTPLLTKLIKLPAITIRKSPEIFDKAPAIERPPTKVTYENLLDPEKLLVSKKFSKELQEMITKETTPVGSRSTFLMRLGYLLAAASCTELEIISLLYHADNRIKKFVGRPDQLVRLSEIVSIVSLEIHRETHIQGYSPEEVAKYELELDWIIKEWLHSYGIMMVTGQPGVGKTQFCFDLAHKMATGQLAYGRVVKFPVKVAILSLEMDITELKYISIHQNPIYEKLTSWKLFNENVRVYAPDFDNSNFAAFEKIIVEQKPQVMIIDSLSELASDDMKETEARSIMRWIRKISKENHCGIILIHHNRKASDANKKPRKLGDLYGSYIFAKTAATVISLWDDDTKDYLEVDFLKVRFGKKDTIKIKRTEHLTFEEFTTEDAKEAAVNKNSLLSFVKE